MKEEMTPRERVLGLLNNKKIDRTPCFSGMGNITVEGLKKFNFNFPEIHTDAKKMAIAAASTYKLFEFESAIVPFDLGIEAEALGCEINFYEHKKEGILYPTVKTKAIKFGEELSIPEEFIERGRIPLLLEAIKLMKEDVGSKVCTGSYILGPFTLAGQVMDLNDLLKMSFKKPDEIKRILDSLTSPLIALGEELKGAGADFITIREMGAPPDVISPKMFESLIVPSLKKVTGHLGKPRILHICGNTNPIVELMYKCGAEAISVEQKNDISQTRSKLGRNAIILGNIDPYNVLVKGAPDEVEESVRVAIKNGVNGVMPGCDIWPEVPPENMRALVKATKRYGTLS